MHPSTGTLATQLYLDSQQTIINQLKDTFSCNPTQSRLNIGSTQNPVSYATTNNFPTRNPSRKPSRNSSTHSTNILKINTSTYSVARTAQHIAQRLDDACRRIQGINASVSKSRDASKNKSHNNSQIHYHNLSKDPCNASVISQSKKSSKSNHTKITKGHKANNIISQIRPHSVIYNIQQSPPFDLPTISNQQPLSSQSHILQILESQSIALQSQSRKIQTLQDQLVESQNKFLSLQQKYLKKQNLLILEVNRLKQLLRERQLLQNRHFNEKLEIQRLVDQHKVKIWELQAKLREFEVKGKQWQRKEGMLKMVTKKYYAEVQNQENNLNFNNNGKTLTKRYKKQKNSDRQKESNCNNTLMVIINSLMNILGVQYENQSINDEQNKQNNCQHSNRGQNVQNNHIDKLKAGQRQQCQVTQTHRSYTVQKQKKPLQQQSSVKKRSHYNINQNSNRNMVNCNINGHKNPNKAQIYNSLQENQQFFESIVQSGNEQQQRDIISLHCDVSHNNEDKELYRFLFLQAATIEKLTNYQ